MPASTRQLTRPVRQARRIGRVSCRVVAHSDNDSSTPKFPHDDKSELELIHESTPSRRDRVSQSVIDAHAQSAQSEPIPGYRLIEPLGKGGFGEVWKCEAPGGLLKAIKFIDGGDSLNDLSGAASRQELRALQLIKTIRHPFLLSIERIEVIDGQVLIVMELADRSLHDLLTERRTAGQAGIPRSELLSYLRESAEAIDVLNQEYGLQHLDVKPRNLFLIGRHVKVADFGLVASLSDLQSQTSWARRSEALTPLYAAPETFLGRFTLFSDQYSLAISYQELLTGTLPFTGRNVRQLALKHVQEPPDLEPLPEAERPILARALAKEPRKRYASCSAFVQALLALDDVPAPQPAKPNGTHADLDLGELAATPKVSREVRIVSVPAAAPPAGSPKAEPPSAAGAADRAKEMNHFLAGYQLLECVNRHAAAEVWKAQTSDGRKRLVKILNGFDADEEWPNGDPLARLRELRHPALPRFDIQARLGGRLALITDLPDGSLADRLRECQQIGQQGIPRLELLAYLRQAAEALDDLYEDYRLQHLCLTPRQLVLRSGLLYLLDFALLELLWLPSGHDPAALNTRYAAPELFERQFSRHADQYSLALIYQELLTGIHAFRNYNQRQMALARLRGQPDLGMLPATDRPVISQALAVDPDQRFPSCTALVDALDEVAAGRGLGHSSRGTHVPTVTAEVPALAAEKPPERGRPPAWHWEQSLAEMKQIFAEQIAEAAADTEIRVRRSLRYRIHRPRRGESAPPSLEQFAYGRIVPATTRLKLTSFQEQWKARPVEAPKESDASSDGRVLVSNWLYRVGTGANLWQRWLGQSPSLLVQIELAMPRTSTEGFIDVLLRIHANDRGTDKGMEMLEEMGSHLLRSVREHLQLPPERRGEERFGWMNDVQVRPMFNERDLGAAIAAQTKDISNGGVGLELPCRPPCEFLLLQMNAAPRAALALPLQVLHAHPLGDGRHHVGARIAWELVANLGA